MKTDTFKTFTSSYYDFHVQCYKIDKQIVVVEDLHNQISNIKQLTFINLTEKYLTIIKQKITIQNKINCEKL